MSFPVDERFIAAAEQRLGRSLPAGLRTRLSRKNGGWVQTREDDWSLHPIWDPSDHKRISRTSRHIVRETEQARQAPSFPPGAIAIGNNVLGDRLVARPGSDEIEAWRCETGRCSRIELLFN
jgi:hypothetical protein